MLRSLSTKSIVGSLSIIFITFLNMQCAQQSEQWDSFGEKIALEKVPNTEEIIAGLSSSDSMEVKFSGTIEEVCQMKGCWMTLKSENGERIRVTFKDYGFFVPKGSAGSSVVVNGLAFVKELDEETARHFADDSNREFNPETDMKEVSIVASGVLIKKTDQL